MARLYRSFSFAPGDLDADAIAAVYAQLKADILADEGFLTRFVTTGSYDYLFFWPAQHGATPDYTNDDVAIWCVEHANIGAWSDCIEMFPYRGAVADFDGTQDYSSTTVQRADPVRWDYVAQQNVPVGVALLYTIASDVPLLTISVGRDKWDGAQVIQGYTHVCAITFRRIAADMGNGLATRYGVAYIDSDSDGDGYITLGAMRSADTAGAYDIWQYPSFWSPLPFASQLTLGGVTSPVARTAVAPIYPLLYDPAVACVVFGEANGLHLMAGRPTSLPEVIAPGLMAIGPAADGIGATIAIPACSAAA